MSTRLPLGRLLAEFFVIVIGVLVALGVDQWIESLDNRELVEETLRALAAEIDGNADRVQERLTYHEEILPGLNELQRAVESGQTVRISVGEALPNGLGLFAPRSTAWEMAAITEAVRHFDLPLLSFLSVTYGLQETLVDRGRAIVAGTTRPEIFSQSDQRGSIIFLSVTIEDLRATEDELVRLYREALRLVREALGDPEAGSVIRIT